MAARVLVTGFEPFGGSTVNPSQLLVERLAAAPPAEVELSTALLPVSYGRTPGALLEALRASDPEVVVCFGQASRRTAITVERVALNLDDASDADNEGVVSSGPIEPDAPASYWSTLPVDELVAELRSAGVPAAVSRDAGGYLCNRVFFTLMRYAATERPGLMGGFVHVPALPEQTLESDLPSMPLDVVERAARVVLEVAARAHVGLDGRGPRYRAVDYEALRRQLGGRCFICELIDGNPEFRHHVVYEDDVAVAFLQRYQRLYGYVLVAPRGHREHVTGDFTSDEYLALQAVVHRVGEAIRRSVPTERLYVLSLGSQQANRHVHWHLAPLPPGVPFEQQQFAALDKNIGLDLDERELEDLAARLRAAIAAVPA
ncbi:MAG TPA: HIT domain-containing protein [Gaiellaceae bacterium]